MAGMISWFKEKGAVTRDRTRRRYSPEVAGLETRSMLTVTDVSTFVAPQILWPPNGRIAPVWVAGMVTDNLMNGPVSARFQVFDEYGAVQPSGPVALHAVPGMPGVDLFWFMVDLPVGRFGQDHDGRQFAIAVTAQDQQNALTGWSFVTVPHDMGHPFIFGLQNGVLTGVFPAGTGVFPVGAGFGEQGNMDDGGDGPNHHHGHSPGHGHHGGGEGGD